LLSGFAGLVMRSNLWLDLSANSLGVSMQILAVCGYRVRCN